LEATRVSSKKLPRWRNGSFPRSFFSALTDMLADFCDLYNGGLQQRIEAYQRRGVSLSYVMQTSELRAIRTQCPELSVGAAAACVPLRVGWPPAGLPQIRSIPAAPRLFCDGDWQNVNTAPANPMGVTNEVCGYKQATIWQTVSKPRLKRSYFHDGICC